MLDINGKFFFDKMGDKIVEKFPDPVQANAMFEIAQKMLDEGKDKKEIKKILKDLYGASKDELDRLEDKLFKNKVNAEIHPDAVLTELKSIDQYFSDFLEGKGWAGGDDLEYIAEGKEKLEKLIKELEGDKGKRQEGTEKTSEDKNMLDVEDDEKIERILNSGYSSIEDSILNLVFDLKDVMGDNEFRSFRPEMKERLEEIVRESF